MLDSITVSDELHVVLIVTHFVLRVYHSVTGSIFLTICPWCHDRVCNTDRFRSNRFKKPNYQNQPLYI